jgi:hypothetical protein
MFTREIVCDFFSSLPCKANLTEIFASVAIRQAIIGHQAFREHDEVFLAVADETG